ncbi:hypothetical protein [Tannockella kyphosi]|uniref:hypothetical protein n=1 Tax=Tannockella kyphosi TaxID=2899121 RepID=UPI00201109D5|nr:hypothetical protein [Tannockella kyphosi]
MTIEMQRVLFVLMMLVVITVAVCFTVGNPAVFFYNKQLEYSIQQIDMNVMHVESNQGYAWY